MKLRTKIVAGALGLLLIIGLITIASTKNSDRNTLEQSSTGQQTLDIRLNPDSDTPKLPEEIISGAFVMKASVADSSGSSGEFIIDFVSKDEFQLTGVFDGQQIAYVVSGGYAYINNGGEWARTSSSGIESLFSIEDLSLSANDYEQFKQESVYLGLADCVATECDVWEANVPAEDAETNYAKVFVAKDTRQVVRIEAETSDGSTAQVDYDYQTRPIVKPPSEYTDLNLFGL